MTENKDLRKTPSKKQMARIESSAWHQYPALRGEWLAKELTETKSERDAAKSLAESRLQQIINLETGLTEQRQRADKADQQLLEALNELKEVNDQHEEATVAVQKLMASRARLQGVLTQILEVATTAFEPELQMIPNPGGLVDLSKITPAEDAATTPEPDVAAVP